MSESRAEARGEDEPDLSVRLRLAQLWLFVLLMYAGVLAATVGDVGESNTVYWFVIALTGVLAAVVFVISGLRPRTYGLTLENAQACLYSALVSTGLLALVGALAVAVVDGLGWLDPALPLVDARLDGQTIAYVVVAAPLQELVFRGLFQTGARVIFGGEERRRAAVAAVAFSTLAFALSHLPWGVLTVVVMIVPGVVWGVQAERDRSLVGVTLSHAAVGYLLVGVSPLWSVLRSVA